MASSVPFLGFDVKYEFGDTEAYLTGNDFKKKDKGERRDSNNSSKQKASTSKSRSPHRRGGRNDAGYGAGYSTYANGLKGGGYGSGSGPFPLRGSIEKEIDNS